jgi:pilus assembly protein CpaF
MTQPPWDPVEDLPFVTSELDDLFGDSNAPVQAPDSHAPSAWVSGPTSQTPPGIEPLHNDPPRPTPAPPETIVEHRPLPSAPAHSPVYSPAHSPAHNHASLPQAPAPALGSRIQDMRSAAEAASLPQDGKAHEIAERTAFEHRLATMERLFVLVDRILGLVNMDVELQNWANSVVLTRSPEVDERQRRELEERLAPRMLDARIIVESAADAKAIFDLAYDELTGISVLGELWRDESVDEICIDAWNKIAVERHGHLERTGYRFRSPDHARSIARTLSQKISDRGVSNVNSLVTAQLPQARVQFVYGPLSAAGLAITIRKFRPLMGMAKLLEVGALTQEMADFLAACVRSRATIIVSGGTGTGKTTAINALSESIPDSERVITIEDAFELQLSNTHVVSLQAKQRATSDDLVVVSQADLLVASLRMRPDRIVVGEIREANAASVFFDAASTGHDGSMTIIHADSTTSALNNRLSALLMRSEGGFSEPIARLSVAQAVQLVVQITRRRGRRFVSEIAVVDQDSVSDGSVRPQALYTGEVDVDGNVSHKKVGALVPGTQLEAKLTDCGEEVGRWLAR